MLTSFFFFGAIVAFFGAIVVFFGTIFVFFVGAASSVSAEVELSTSHWRLGLLAVVLTLFACAGSDSIIAASSASWEHLPLGAALLAPFWAGVSGMSGFAGVSVCQAVLRVSRVRAMPCCRLEVQIWIQEYVVDENRVQSLEST